MTVNEPAPPVAAIAKLPLPLSCIVMFDPAVKLPDKNPPKPSATCIDPTEPEDSFTLKAVINYTQTKTELNKTHKSVSTLKHINIFILHKK